MTKQHFEVFARYIRNWGSGPVSCNAERKILAEMVVDIALEFNPRFDYASFWAACGLPPMSS